MYLYSQISLAHQVWQGPAVLANRVRWTLLWSWQPPVRTRRAFEKEGMFLAFPAGERREETNQSRVLGKPLIPCLDPITCWKYLNLAEAPPVLNNNQQHSSYLWNGAPLYEGGLVSGFGGGNEGRRRRNVGRPVTGKHANVWKILNRLVWCRLKNCGNERIRGTRDEKRRANRITLYPCTVDKSLSL